MFDIMRSAKSMKQIILASESPRRKELLERIGLKFQAIESNIDEDIYPDLSPADLAEKLSLEKAKAVFKTHKDSIIIAADTVISCDNQILGKPKDKKDVKRMLSLLSNNVHLVITGFTIIDGKRQITKSQKSKVYMRKISKSEIDAYIKTGEPFGKAGAYAIQEKGGIFVKKVVGDHFNVVGLPIFSLMGELRKLGVEVL